VSTVEMLDMSDWKRPKEQALQVSMRSASGQVRNVGERRLGLGIGTVGVLPIACVENKINYRCRLIVAKRTHLWARTWRALG